MVEGRTITDGCRKKNPNYIAANFNNNEKKENIYIRRRLSFYFLLLLN